MCPTIARPAPRARSSERIDPVRPATDHRAACERSCWWSRSWARANCPGGPGEGSPRRVGGVLLVVAFRGASSRSVGAAPGADAVVYGGAPGLPAGLADGLGRVAPTGGAAFVDRSRDPPAPPRA